MSDPILIPGPAALKQHIGVPMGPSEWITVTQEKIDLFARATGDTQWIHTDVERAKRESPFGGPVAHGYLTASLGPALVDQLYVVKPSSVTVNYGIEKMRLHEPVLAGGRIRLSAEITKVRMLPSGGARTTVRFQFEVDGGTRPACVVDAVIVYFP